MSYLESFQGALVIILIEGVVFLVLSVLNVREKIVHAIPLGIRLGISPAIGLMLLTMPISGSIGHAIGLGMIIYTFMKIFSGKTKEVSWLTYAISALFIVKFFLAV